MEQSALEDAVTASVRQRGGVPLTTLEECCVQHTVERERVDSELEDWKHIMLEKDNVSSTAVPELLAQQTAQQKPRLLHVVQRLPEGSTIAAAQAAAVRILNIAGVGPGARYYLEQDGECANDIGKRIHIHLALFFNQSQSVLAQRIVQKKLAAPNMTQVFKHDNLFKLTRYLTGHKSPDKARKVAADKAWRKANGLKAWYTLEAASDKRLDDHGAPAD